MISFGVDIGGSGVKGAAVDIATGDLVSKRFRLDTPDPSTPGAVITAVGEILALYSWDRPVGVTIPATIVGGVVYTAPNIDASWIELDARTAMSDQLGLQISVINDADAAGLAEVRYGQDGNREGVVLLLTFGTGIGSALFNNGELLPNTEFGHLEFHGMIAEAYAAGKLVKRDNMDIRWWADRVNEYLQYLETVLAPDKIIIGGGISKRFNEFGQFLETRAEVVPARLRNNAGIVGAAMIAAAEELT